MIGIEGATIKKLTHHKISSEEHKCIFGDKLFEYTNEEEENILKKLFLKPFLTTSETFEFNHPIDLSYNVLFNLVKKIREGESFIEQSRQIIEHLISSSKHPNIKDGDLFIAKFEGLKFGNQDVEGAGIYKFEDKDAYLDTAVNNNETTITFRKGIGNKKPDKACLVLFTEEDFTILILDSNNKETDYWQNDFINHKPKNDHVNSTNNFLAITKEFITTRISEDFEVSKADQIDLLNRSVNYFKTREHFEKTEFEEEVFGNNDVIESFQKFDQTYREDREIELSNNFEISDQVVKKQARTFKSVLKLDKNFHIYIHGNKELIEQGVDNDGRKFYKIYYKEEK